jgi:hypothetical protein
MTGVAQGNRFVLLSAHSTLSCAEATRGDDAQHLSTTSVPSWTGALATSELMIPADVPG